MTMIPIFETKISLPELKIKDIKIGSNKVRRFAVRTQSINVTVCESGHNGWYELKTELPRPYDYLYLRDPKKRIQKPKGTMCVEFCKRSRIDDLDEIKKLKWIKHPAMGDAKEPNDIVHSWAGLFRFNEENPNMNQSGLRPPQLGALHAISAYFTSKRNIEPATVVLPTGTGKTETMLSTMVYRQLPKVLVLVPSNPLRDQICDKFLGLGYLSKLGVLPMDVNLPAVVSIKNGIKSIIEADDLLKNANVFVATASVLNSSNQNAIDNLCGGIFDLFVDEAHHITASTWAQVKKRFSGKRIVQFTATPFRNDGSALGGRIIYNYSMSEAQNEKYFAHINLIPVEEYYEGEEDRVIAQAAIKQLRKDIDGGYDHLLMARVNEKCRADVLLPIYQNLAPDLKPVLVYTGKAKSELKHDLLSLIRGESKIVICVNMLGEGFDLPNLKIAAIHDIHKSLPITLQFVGRFTRYKPNLGDASVIVNIADPGVETGLQHLYAQGADWDQVLRRLSESRIDREVRLQEVVENLKEKGTLHKQISLWNLRPSCSAILFKTDCDNWNPERFKEVMPDKTECWFAISEEECLLIILAVHHAPLQWGNFRELTDSVYKLLIANWDKDRRGLFVFSNDYKWFRVEKMATLLCNEQCELLSGPRVFNIFNGLKYPIVRNLGASQIGAISFTQYFGSNVTEGLSRIESAKSNLSNLAGLGYDDGEKVIWGCSQKKGKIWSVKGGSISDWLNWVKAAWDKVTSGEVDEANITRDFLRPERITTPYSEYAISVQWGEHIQADPEDRVVILFGDTEIPLYLVDLRIASQGGQSHYGIAIFSDSTESVYQFTISDNIPNGFGYKLIKGEAVSIKRGNGIAKPLEEYLQSDPWIIQYADGSFSYNCFLIKLPQSLGEFSSEQIECWNWSGINIKKESMGKGRDVGTVQWRSFEYIEGDYDVIINDDGSGEAADLVGLKINGDEISLGLVHCKYSGSDQPGSRIKDLYELCGQAQKSIRWKHAGIVRLYTHLKGREEIWKNEGNTRFLKGSISDLANIKRRSRTAPVKLQVCIVQPGLKKENVTPEMLRVIGCTAIYLKNTAQTELHVVGSGATDDNGHA